MAKELIAVLDFGGQYSHLITRRVRECEVYSELLPYTVKPQELLQLNAKGIVLSGGPASVYAEGAPKCDSQIFGLGIPVLGICYGLQLMVQTLGGRIKATNRREYGKTELKIKDSSDLFRGIEGGGLISWMSHGDYADTLPEGFEVIASSENCYAAAIRDTKRQLYAVQFHPEVAHTQNGIQIIKNFATEISRCSPTWNVRSIVETAVRQVRSQVGNEHVLSALSGGVDSTTTAVLVQRAVGSKLECIFVNHGLLRKNEEKAILGALKELKLNVHYVNASERFFKRLVGVADPEEKRKVVGEEFIRIFDEESAKLGTFRWLAQGTLYPDVIESAGTGSPASRIKTHHNVGGIPEWSKFKILEPLKFLYKDEVRKIAKELGVPDIIVKTHPFPGPGLAVRIIGEVTKEKIRICKDASAIVEDVLQHNGLYDVVWQAFATVGDDKAVGVLGDQRQLGHMVTVRIVKSLDGMTADWARVPAEVMEQISNRITGEVPGVTWVSYAITSKPPSTIEPC